MNIKQTVDEVILEVLGERTSKADLVPEARLVDNLGATSIQLLEIALTIAAELDIDISKEGMRELHTLGDVYRVVAEIKGVPATA